MNYFSSPTAAERYAQGRPYFHPAVINRIKSSLSLVSPVQHAIDVGCGTGLSSIALEPLAARINGIDSSLDMIRHARRKPNVSYVVADAHQLPFHEASCDLMTLSQSFHWLNRQAFLDEAKRVLHPTGWLVVYDNYFTGRMEGNENFAQWFNENHPKRFPAPERAKLSFSEQEFENAGFRLVRHDRFSHTWPCSLAGLINYLITHSNVIAAVEYGNDELDEVRQWLTKNIRPFYAGYAHATFIFDAVLWCLQRPE